VEHSLVFKMLVLEPLLRSDLVSHCSLRNIDEHEVNHLGMLLEQVFPEYLRRSRRCVRR
jgi:hypothetical protein